MHFTSTLSHAASQAFAECLENLQIDFERFREQIQQQFVGLLGHRVGDWASKTLYSILRDGSEVCQRSSDLYESEHQLLPGEYETHWWDQQEQGVLQHAPPCSDTQRTARSIGLGLTIQAMVWWLGRKSQSCSGIAVPLVSVLGSWLCDRLTRHAQSW